MFKGDALEILGLPGLKVRESLNVDLRFIPPSEQSSDLFLLLEDGRILHVEFQTSPKKSDLKRFRRYNLLCNEMQGREVITLIVYPASVKVGLGTLNTGSLVFEPLELLFSKYDGDVYFAKIKYKLETGQQLVNRDYVTLAFLQLMNHKVTEAEMAEASMDLAQRIPDVEMRDVCSNMIYFLGEKYLDEEQFKNLEGVFMMTETLSRMIESRVSQATEYYEEKLKQLEDEKIESARELLKNGLTVEIIIATLKMDTQLAARFKNEIQ
jgi:hypothetical protein